MPLISPRYFATAITALLLACSADAAVRRIVNVSYETRRGWSDQEAVEVQFFLGSELNKATDSYDYTSWQRYAVIFFSPEQAAVVEIEQILGIHARPFEERDFCDLFQYQLIPVEGIQINAAHPRKWRFEARQLYGGWIDPRAKC